MAVGVAVGALLRVGVGAGVPVGAAIGEGEGVGAGVGATWKLWAGVAARVGIGGCVGIAPGVRVAVASGWAQATKSSPISARKRDGHRVPPGTALGWTNPRNASDRASVSWECIVRMVKATVDLYCCKVSDRFAPGVELIPTNIVTNR